jgi:quinol monooxygenase YgiN
MLISMIQVEVKKNKRDEFLNTLATLKKRFNQARGCTAYHLGRDLENENLFQLISEWRTQEDYDKHVTSPEFEVLQGAIQILGLNPQARILKIDEVVKGTL